MPNYSTIYATQDDIDRVNTAAQTNPDSNNPGGNGFFNWNISSNGYINFPALISLYDEIKAGTFDPNTSINKHLHFILNNLVEIQKIGNSAPGYSGQWNDLIKQKKYAEIVTKLAGAGILGDADHLCKHAGMIVLSLIALDKSNKNVVEELTSTLDTLQKDIDSFSRTIARLEIDHKGTTDERVIENIKFLKSELSRLTFLSKSLPDAITFLGEHNSTESILKLFDDLNTACKNQFAKDIQRGIQIELGGITQTYHLSDADFMTMMRRQLKLQDSEIAFIINGWHQNAIPAHATPLSVLLSKLIDPAGNSSMVMVQPTPIKITIKDGKLVEISSVSNYKKSDITLNGNNQDVIVGTSTVKYTAASNPKGITSNGDNRTGSFPDINLDFSYQAKTPEGKLKLSIDLPTVAPQAVQTQTEVPRPSPPAASASNRAIRALERFTKKPKGELPISREPKGPDVPSAKSDTRTINTATATQPGAYSDPLGVTAHKPAAPAKGSSAAAADTPATPAAKK
jgi:hypothetical protein